MKNKLLRIVSAVMAVSVMFSVYGCKDKDGKKDGAQDSSAVASVSGEASDKKAADKTDAASEEKASSATAVFEYTTIDSNKKEKNTTGVYEYNPNANYNIVRSGETLKETFESNPSAKENLKKKIDNYKIDEKEYNEVVNKAENWVNFEYGYIVVNTTPKRIAFDRLSHTKADGLIVNDYCIGCEMSIDSAQSMEILIDGMYDSSKYSDEEAVKKALTDMDLNIMYIHVENMDQLISDFDNPQFKKLPVDFSR